MKNKRATSERFVRLPVRMMQTEAWQSLDGNARAIYVELAMLYYGIGTNNGQIGLSVRQAAKAIHVSKDTAARAMSHLQDRGFIVATSKGQFVQKRQATRWRLTEFRCDVTGQPASRDFEDWTAAVSSQSHIAERVRKSSKDG